MTIKKFDYDNIAFLQNYLNEKLEEIGYEFGISIKVKGGKFGDFNGNLNLEVAVIENGITITKTISDWNAHCWDYGLKPEDFGRIFNFKGKRYQIVGIQTKNTKMPILVKLVSLKGIPIKDTPYKMYAHAVVWALQQDDKRKEKK